MCVVVCVHVSHLEELRMLEELETNHEGATSESKDENVEASHDHVKDPHPTVSST